MVISFFFLLWITVITLDNNPVTLVIHRRAPLAIGLEPFSSGTQKKCNFASWILYLRSEMKSSCWMKVIFCDCEHYLSCPTCAATAHIRTQSESQSRFLWVILANDSGPVIVSSAAGSEASLNYWPAPVSHWAKTQGWWHRRWEHVNFAL